MTDATIDIATVQELVGRWWLNYDEGEFEVLTGLLTDDVHFSCRTDTGDDRLRGVRACRHPRLVAT